jgi:hypothetical protein
MAAGMMPPVIFCNFVLAEEFFDVFVIILGIFPDFRRFSPPDFRRIVATLRQRIKFSS